MASGVLPTSVLDQAIVATGTTASAAPLLERLERGEPIVLGVFGASVAQNSGCLDQPHKRCQRSVAATRAAGAEPRGPRQPRPSSSSGQPNVTPARQVRRRPPHVHALGVATLPPTQRVRALSPAISRPRIRRRPAAPPALRAASPSAFSSVSTPRGRTRNTASTTAPSTRPPRRQAASPACRPLPRPTGRRAVPHCRRGRTPSRASSRTCPPASTSSSSSSARWRGTSASPRSRASYAGAAAVALAHPERAGTCHSTERRGAHRAGWLRCRRALCSCC